jgi:hypothetical protein
LRFPLVWKRKVCIIELEKMFKQGIDMTLRQKWFGCMSTVILISERK